MPEPNLTVAVTGPTGTFGFGLVPLLEADERVARIVGIARRPFDAREHGWTKMTYRRGDVRDRAALEEGFQGADVVVHLAFMITGAASLETIRQINVEGTLNAFRAAAAVGARRFVYASSVAAYGFHRDNPVGMTEDWPVRPAAHLFYAQEKAQIERLLEQEAAGHAGLGVYLLRPPIVLGPDVVGAKNVGPGTARAACPPARRRRGAGAAARDRAAGARPVHPRRRRRSGVLALHRRRRSSRRVQHHRRRRAERRGGPPRARARRRSRPRLGSYARPPAASRPCRSPRRSPGGRRRSATRRSWTRARPSGNSAGARGTAASRRYATHSGLASYFLRKK